jgi:hypothetical protein
MAWPERRHRSTPTSSALLGGSATWSDVRPNQWLRSLTAHGDRPESPGCDSKRIVKSGIPDKEAFSVKRNLVLPVTSLLSILLASFHLVDDIVYGSDNGVASNIVIVAILAVWLYGTLMLLEGRVGHMIMLIGSLLGLTIFWTHLNRRRGPSGHRDRQIERSLFLRLDAPGARGTFSVVARALSAWSMESAALEVAMNERAPTS